LQSYVGSREGRSLSIAKAQRVGLTTVVQNVRFVLYAQPELGGGGLRLVLLTLSGAHQHCSVPAGKHIY
jgi:hypothetical protein